METAEKNVRIECPLENARSRNTIAATSETRVTANPNVRNASGKPPATAPSPVAFLAEISFAIVGNMNTGMGIQARSVPHRKRFLVTSSSA